MTTTPSRSRTALILAAAGLAALASPATAGDPPLSTGFSYQGLLTNQGQPVEGPVFFRFTLWDSENGGGQLAPDQQGEITLDKGLLNTTLDFGVDPFNSERSWLQIEFDAPNDGQNFITLPRQQIAATPYALQTRGIYLDGEGEMFIYSENIARVDEQISIKNRDGQMILKTRGPNGPKDAISIDRGEFIFFDDDEDANVVIQNRGRVGIGTNNPQDELHVSGTVRAQAVRLTGGADIAEPFDVTYAGHIVPGMVVAIDPAVPGGLRVADAAYDATVAGIISGAGGINAGMTLAQEGTLADGEHPVALTGRVWCLVDADANGAVKAGDMLTTSSSAGHAMKATDRDLAFGSTIGKAMTTLESGKGHVLVLVNLQ